MNPEHVRIVEVSREWFEQLEEYLHSDERLVPRDEDGDALLLLTPAGKKLHFRIKLDP